jgi:hypothetical protein
MEMQNCILSQENCVQNCGRLAQKWSKFSQCPNGFDIDVRP